MAVHKGVEPDDPLLEAAEENLELPDGEEAEERDDETGAIPTGYEQVRYRLIGSSPYISHNGSLADPMSEGAKALRKATRRGARTDADYALMAETEFKYSLYLHEELGPVVPGVNVEALLVAAAKKKRMGAQAKAGLICEGVFPLEYEGPRDQDGLWADQRFRLVSGVVVQRNRVMRTRPCFHKWAVTIAVEYEPTAINKADLDEIVRLAGRVVGLGDWRPRYGRFNVEVLP